MAAATTAAAAAPLCFQLVDVHIFDHVPLASLQEHDELLGDDAHERILEAHASAAKRWDLTVVLFGRTLEGESVCCLVSGFEPELFYEAEAVSDAVQRGLLECPEYTLAETLGAMETMDTIRAHLGVRYACDTAGAGDR